MQNQSLLSCRDHATKQQPEPTDSIAVASSPIYFLAFSAQKLHVKPRNPINYSNKRKCKLKISYLQTAILKIEEKTITGRIPRLDFQANSFRWNILDVTYLL
jgi:hypothetical protein